MWPYNDCEWKTITYGAGAMKQRAEQKRNKKILMVCSLIPSLLLILSLIIFVK